MESMIFVEPQLGGIGGSLHCQESPPNLFLDDVDGTQKSGAGFFLQFSSPLHAAQLRI